MEYRCPVCGFTTASDAILARHMASTLTLYEHHLEWIESKGIALEKYSPVRSLKEQKEFCNDLREVVARACRIRGCLATAQKPQHRPRDDRREEPPGVTAGARARV